MKYMITKISTYGIENISVTITDNDKDFTGFPAEVGNPNYDQFLEQTGLTDAEVHDLEPNVWYDFPQKEEQ